MVEKELKSGTGVLLRADLTGQSHSTHFGASFLGGGACPVRSALKRTPVQDLFFSVMVYYLMKGQSTSKAFFLETPLPKK